MAESKHIGKYEILEEIGRGGFAVVYKARDIKLGRIVALKVLYPSWTNDSNFIARFQREAHTAIRLRHPRIVTVHEAGEAEGQLYIAMGYLPGCTLQELLEAEGALSPERALPVLEQVAEALDYAHERGMIHRDVKPSNIMVKETEDDLNATLLDFGLVRAMEGSTVLTSQGTVLGSPEYMAPEQADPERAAETGPATDLYALGIIAYQMLTGRVPFPGHSVTTLYAQEHKPVPRPRSLQPDLPKAVEAVLLKMLTKDPADRFPSAGEFVAQLQEAVLHPRREILPARTWMVVGLLTLVLSGGGLLGWMVKNSYLAPDEPTATPTPTPTSTATQTDTPTSILMPTATVTTTPTPTRTPKPTAIPTDTPPSPTYTLPDTVTASPSTTALTPTVPSPVPTTPAPSSTPSPPPKPTPIPGEMGRIFYTIEAGQMYYLASTDPSWSQGRVIDPTTYDISTCAGDTARTLAGQSINLFYGYRCPIAQPTECTSPDGQWKVTVWKNDGDYSVSIYRTSDNELVQAIYTGSLNDREPIMWAPDSSRFYFVIKQTLHQASPYSAGYETVVPNVHEPYLSPDGSMILYLQPVGAVGAYDIWVADANGDNQHNVTNAPDTFKLCARWG